MDMGDSTAHACKISMLFNWYVVDACFLSRDWHVRSRGAFAGTLIGVFLITALVEGVRRAMRECDRYLIKSKKSKEISDPGSITSLTKRDNNDHSPTVIYLSPTWTEQFFRSFLFFVQFSVAFLLMLLGMYFNVAVLLAIFFGAGFGYLVFGRDTLSVEKHEVGASCC